jgi:hypothetical protein
MAIFLEPLRIALRTTVSDDHALALVSVVSSDQPYHFNDQSMIWNILPRQLLEAKNPFNHLVITVVVHISQPAVSDNQMHDQQHHDQVMTIDRTVLQMTEASPQPLLRADSGEEVLKENQARVRSQILRFESNIQSGSGFTSDICFAMFHFSGLRLDGYIVFVDEYCTNSETTFYIFFCAFLSQIEQRAPSHLVGPSGVWLNLTESELKPCTVLLQKHQFP